LIRASSKTEAAATTSRATRMRPSTTATGWTKL
jgi:hypothetical protein